MHDGCAVKHDGPLLARSNRFKGRPFLRADLKRFYPIIQRQVYGVLPFSRFDFFCDRLFNVLLSWEGDSRPSVDALIVLGVEIESADARCRHVRHRQPVRHQVVFDMDGRCIRNKPNRHPGRVLRQIPNRLPHDSFCFAGSRLKYRLVSVHPLPSTPQSCTLCQVMALLRA